MSAENSRGANLGFEDKLRAAAEYKHVVLGLIFMKYISDAFMGKFIVLQADSAIQSGRKRN